MKALMYVSLIALLMNGTAGAAAQAGKCPEELAGPEAAVRAKARMDLSAYLKTPPALVLNQHGSVRLYDTLVTSAYLIEVTEKAKAALNPSDLALSQFTPPYGTLKTQEGTRSLAMLRFARKLARKDGAPYFWDSSLVVEIGERMIKYSPENGTAGPLTHSDPAVKPLRFHLQFAADNAVYAGGSVQGAHRSRLFVDNILPRLQKKIAKFNKEQSRPLLSETLQPMMGDDFFTPPGVPPSHYVVSIVPNVTPAQLARILEVFSESL